MNHCTGIMGRVCSCGMFHANGGRQVDTQQHEAPRSRYSFAPGVIEGPDDDSDFLRQDNALFACIRWCLAGLAGWLLICAAAGFIARYFGWL